jgi:flagellar hook assembly protein FlgD
VADTSVQIDENSVLFANTKMISASVVDRPLTVIFDVARPADVDISIFTVAGEEIYRSERRSVNPGDPHSFTWSARNENDEPVASGVYIVQARIGSEVRHQKVLVVR